MNEFDEVLQKLEALRLHYDGNDSLVAQATERLIWRASQLVAQAKEIAETAKP